MLILKQSSPRSLVNRTRGCGQIRQKPWNPGLIPGGGVPKMTLIRKAGAFKFYKKIGYSESKELVFMAKKLR